MNTRAGLLIILILCGAAWGLTMPLAKIAVSEGYRHFGLIFWQLAISAVILGAITYARGKTMPLGPAQLGMYLFIALIGTVFPNTAGFEAARHLPAGVYAITIAMVPMFAFPIALMLGNDRFSWLRILGLFTGLLGVALLVAPETSLPSRAMIAFIPIALIAPFFYGVEGNVVAKYGTAGLDPIQLLFGASVIGTIISLPLAVFSGHWINPALPWGIPDWALIASSMIHALVYSTYVWLVGRAGAVFAAQVAYLVTGFGVIWSMILLAERYSGWVWLALAAMLIGVFLVQPRHSDQNEPEQTGQKS